jgi:hypothetical protein
VSVHSENCVLGLWIGGGVTPRALHEIAAAISYHLELKQGGPDEPQWHIPPKVRRELEEMENACHAQLSKLPREPVCDLI